MATDIEPNQTKVDRPRPESKSISSSSIQTLDDKEDTEFFPSVMNSTFKEEDIDILKDEKFVVYERMLNHLMSFIYCQSPIAETKKSKHGTSIHYNLFCKNEHLINWKSQPSIGKMPAYNLLISASIFFSDSSFESFRKPVEFTNLNFVNPSTFYKIQQTLVLPTITKQFNEEIQKARDEVKALQDKCVVLGDGRFDSPDKSAKYCTYSMQSPFTKKVVAASTVQTTKGKGSAPLELDSFKKCLTELEVCGFNIESIATDRNKQIAKWIRINRIKINHGYDTGISLRTSTRSLEK